MGRLTLAVLTLAVCVTAFADSQVVCRPDIWASEYSLFSSWSPGGFRIVSIGPERVVKLYEPGETCDTEDWWCDGTPGRVEYENVIQVIVEYSDSTLDFYEDDLKELKYNFRYSDFSRGELSLIRDSGGRDMRRLANRLFAVELGRRQVSRRVVDREKSRFCYGEDYFCDSADTTVYKDVIVDFTVVRLKRK